MSKSINRTLNLGLLLGLTLPSPGAETSAKFLGANSCASSSCHGGGGAKQNQFLVWSLKDFHSERPVATLATARSKQIADALQITDPTTEPRCTSCHAPLNGVPEILRGDYFRVSEGVSCESCHGPAENWLRSHTRTDYSHADRTAAGMRDLQNLYVRANTCVACHQNVATDILNAGHPQLIFELEGQSVAEPKHWTAEKNGNGAQAWLVGQAVALRELSWQIAQQKAATEGQIQRLRALVWIVAKGHSAEASLPESPTVESQPSASDCAELQKWSDQTALAAAQIEWSPALTKKLLRLLADSWSDFGQPTIPASARYAERLVLALDRLVAALPELQHNQPLQAALNKLFKLAQSVPDFDPKVFASALEQFSNTLAAPFRI